MENILSYGGPMWADNLEQKAKDTLNTCRRPKHMYLNDSQSFSIESLAATHMLAETIPTTETKVLKYARAVIDRYRIGLIPWR